MNEKILGKETIELIVIKRKKKAQKLFEVKNYAMQCKKCELHSTRTNVVFGEGNPESPIMFIGEAPGREEDIKGAPFVGEAGKLLTKLLRAVGIDRKNVYITNVLKCRPPGNRDPLQHEIKECFGWLKTQIKIIKPKIICTLGKYAIYSLLSISLPISRIRGKIYVYSGIEVIPTYHPAALLYHPKWKEEMEKDLKTVSQKLAIL
jgi:DNA polymerase